MDYQTGPLSIIYNKNSLLLKYLNFFNKLFYYVLYKGINNIYKIMNEEWRIYKKTIRSIWEVSNYGRVKLNGEMYECKTNNCGYLMFSYYLVSRAVAKLFIPNPNNYNEVDHIDGNKTNNFYLNLRWCTHKQNMNNPITRNQPSEETKAKMSAAKKGNTNSCGKRSKETKAKLSALKKGKSWFVGSDGKRHWTDK